MKCFLQKERSLKHDMKRWLGKSIVYVSRGFWNGYNLMLGRMDVAGLYVQNCGRHAYVVKATC